jgi:polysaccharide deacetylase family protein (PEP-CTERM system associated)
LCFGLTTQELREDLLRSKSILEDLTGQAVWGYRAPSFSITDGVVETMGELGYRYDASHNSFSIDKRHGQPNGLRVDSGREWAFANGILELPVSNLVLRGQSIPWGGGGYFRFWPSRLFHWGVKRILRTDGRYVFYCHPWEIDAGQPRVKEVGFLHRYRHYKNIGGTLKRLDHFLTEFRHHGLVSCRDYLGDRVRGVDWSDPLSRAQEGSRKQ